MNAAAAYVRSAALRFGTAVRRHWLRLLVGAATGFYVAVAVAFAVVLAVDLHTAGVGDDALALVVDGILLAGTYLGALVAYNRRADS